MKVKLLFLYIALSQLHCALMHEDLAAIGATAPASIEAVYAAATAAPWAYDLNLVAPTAYAAHASSQLLPPYLDSAYAAHAHAATYAATPYAHTAYAAPSPYAYAAAAPVAPVARFQHGARVRAVAAGPPITKRRLSIAYAYPGGVAPGAGITAAAPVAPVAYASPAASLLAAAFGAPSYAPPHAPDPLPFGIIG